jgi:hypothetical protein
MTSPPSGPPADRRKNLLLRTLIDDMMEQLRELQRHAGPWPPEERARLEADLERIMAQVRSQAFTPGSRPQS